MQTWPKHDWIRTVLKQKTDCIMPCPISIVKLDSNTKFHFYYFCSWNNFHYGKNSVKIHFPIKHFVHSFQLKYDHFTWCTLSAIYFRIKISLLRSVTLEMFQPQNWTEIGQFFETKRVIFSQLATELWIISCYFWPLTCKTERSEAELCKASFFLRTGNRQRLLNHFGC